MSGDLVLGEYRPGATWLHGLPASVKLVALLLLGSVLVVVRPWPVAASAVVSSLGLAVWSGLGWRTTVRTLRGILLVATLLGAWMAWQHGWPRAVDSVGDLVALVLAAAVLTATTSVDEMVDTLTRALRPFRRLGVDPEAVALAFSLVIRAIPTTMEIARQTRDAALARGLERDPRARLTPMVIRVVGHARATGEALHARGVTD